LQQEGKIGSKNALEQLPVDEKFIRDLMELLFGDRDKFPIKKIAACPGTLNAEQRERLDKEKIMFFNIEAHLESLQRILQETDTKITAEAQKKLMAVFAFLHNCQLYETEKKDLVAKIKGELKKEDLEILQKIQKGTCLPIQFDRLKEGVKNQQKSKILKNTYHGMAAKQIVEILKTQSHIEEANTQEINYLSKQFHVGNTFVFLDPIQQQIIDDKNPKQLILGSAGTGKTVLLQLKARQLLKADPACKVLIILPLKGVVDVYKSHFGLDVDKKLKPAIKDQLFIMTFREDWKKITEDHKPHILIDEFAYIQVMKHLKINR
jgi:hypothetical protein